MESHGDSTSPNSFTLHIVSPSVEVPDRLTFSISPATTIQELKRRIQDVVPSKPAPERQRLIYKGKALVQQDTTLGTIFGSEEIQNSESITLHLVLPPSPPNPHQPTATRPAPLPPARSEFFPTPPSLDAEEIRSIFQGQQPPRPASISPGTFRATPHDPSSGRPHSPIRNPFLGRQDQQRPSAERATRTNGGWAQAAGGPNDGQPIDSDFAELTRGLAESMQQMGTFNGQPNQAPPQNQPTSSTIIREGHYGNGQYRIVMNQTTATIPIIRNGPQGNPQIQPMNNAAGNAVPSLPSFPALLSTLPVPVPPPSTVYLLSSPTGPQAIVMAPGGTYTTPGLGQFGQGAPQLPFRQPNYDYIAELRARVEQLSRNRPNVQAPLQANGQVPQPQNNPALENPAANPQDEQRDQVNDLIQLLIPLGTHLWLFIRLFGFVYLFAGGAAWSRTIMLGVGAAVIFLAQTGMFQPFQEAVWHPIRRHIEGIVQNDIDGRADYPVRVGGRAQGPTNPADPQQLADRMIRERQERDTNVILSTIRRAERSIVLLIASLVPGVGERHIAARDAAEAAARQEREREEQARQELEERARQSNEATQGSPSDANTAAENALD